MGMIMKSFAEDDAYGCDLARQPNIKPMTYGLRKSDLSVYVTPGDKEPTAIFDCKTFGEQFTQEQFDWAIEKMVKAETLEMLCGPWVNENPSFNLSDDAINEIPGT